MNRLVKGVTALCVGAALCCAPNAFARKHHHKKKTRFSQVDTNPLANLKTKQPDAELFNKAMKSMRKGRYDVARLELETLLNTYPDSEYAMRAKLAVADSWFKEGGAAALEQAEAEYKDFITFFPNTPEAAEAQMKVGDIYYMQMERPDRDPTNALAAEQQYRTMIEQFPDSTLIPEAKQKLRNVQEVLAQAQFEVGTYYSTIEDWPGAIARLETVADLYPLYSKVDADLLLMGDDYANEAQAVSRMRMPAKAKTELLSYYNGRAADAWSAIVEKYPMSPNAENAKDRLIAMGLKIPTPTPEALAESEAMEASMVPVKFKTRALDFFSRAGATPVQAVRVGNPTLTDPPQTYAPAIARQQKAVFIAALRNEPLPTANDENQSTVEAQSGPHMATPSEIRAAEKNSNGEQSTPTASFEDVPTGNADTSSNTATVDAQGGVKTSVHQTPPESSEPAGPDRPAEINGAAIAPAVNTPIAGPVGSSGPKALPAAEKPAEAPSQINDVPDTARGHAMNQATNGKHKKKKAAFNAKEESSSRHKKKKGLHRWLNPF